MAGLGVIIQPAYGMLKVADQLSTKVSVKGVTAGNQRERERFLALCKQVDKTKVITSSEIDFKKNLVRLRMARLQKEADDAKEKRRKEEERRKREEEEREKMRLKAKGRIPFGFKPLRMVSSDEFPVEAEELAELIDVLDLDIEELESDGPGANMIDTDRAEFTAETTSAARLDATSRRSRRKTATRNGNTPAHSAGHHVSKRIAVPASPALSRREGRSRAMVQRVSKANMFTRTLSQMIKADGDGALTPRSRPPVQSRVPGVPPDLVMKAIAGKITEADEGGDERRLILDALRRSALNADAGAANDSHIKKLKRIMTHASLRRFGFSFNRLGTPAENANKDKLVARLKKTPRQIPPMYSCSPLPYRERRYEKPSGDGDQSAEVSDQMWQDIRYCQYIRYTSKFPLIEEPVLKPRREHHWDADGVE